MGIQYPRTGNVLGGFLNEARLWEKRDTIYGYSEPNREYFATPLSDSLIVGKTYCLSMYISVPGNTEYLSNNIGMLLSETAMTNITDKALYGNPQVVEKKTLRDTINWINISGCLLADKPCKYLIIGNFYPEDSTSFVPFGITSSLNYFISYFFIDDISVEEFVAHPLQTSKDTSICKGSSIILTAQGPDHIWWSTQQSPNDTLVEGNALTVSPDSTTSYIVHSADCKCAVENKIITVSLYPLPILDLGKDTALCEGRSILINMPAGFSDPLWSDGSDGNTLTVSQEGNYSLTAKDLNGCTAKDTIQVPRTILVPQVNLGPDVLFCQAFDLHARSGYDVYGWSDGSSSQPTFTVTHPGSYSLNISNACGYAADSVLVKALDGIHVPNLITPNNDGKNDCLIIEVLPGQDRGMLQVFNAWGDQVYRNNAYENEWCGESLSSGIYYYFYSYACFEGKGWVQVIK